MLRAVAVLLLLLPLAANAGSGEPDGDLFVTLELVTEPFETVHVTVRVQAKRGGRTRFQVAEEWGGNTSFENEIHQIRAHDAAGKRLTVEHPEPHQWEVVSANGGWITLDYYLVSNQHEIEAEYSSYYRPIVRDDLFHLVGHTGLMIPLHLAGTAKRTVQIQWRGFSSRGWTVASSFGSGRNDVRAAVTLDELVHSVFLAAPTLRLHDRRVTGGRVHFAIYGDDWGFKDKELVKVAAQIIDAERKLLDDRSATSYTITLIPVGTYDPKSSSVGGTGLTRSFALFMTPKVALTGEQGQRIRYLLAHEHFHHWIGGQIAAEQPEELVYWFTEGFTDFFTRRLLYRTGLFTADEAFADLNRKLSGYLLSPVRNAPNEQVQLAFWNDPRIHELPYHRGDVVAMLVDHEIRRRSGGKRSLDDLLKEILAETKGHKRRVSTGYLLEKIAGATSTEFATTLSGIITDGRTAEIPAGLLGPCGNRVTEQLGPFALGFDLQASIARRKITGVRQGSAAWRAGLRDDQPLHGWSVTHGRIDEPVELTVTSAEALEHKVRYLPQGETIPVAQFRVADKKSCRSRL